MKANACGSPTTLTRQTNCTVDMNENLASDTGTPDSQETVDRAAEEYVELEGGHQIRSFYNGDGD